MPLTFCQITGSLMDLSGNPIANSTINVVISGYVVSGSAIITSSVAISDTLISHYEAQFFTTTSGTFSFSVPTNVVLDISIPQASYHKRVIIPTSTVIGISELQVVEDLW